ncbi:DNA-binding domain-containing protein [Carboxylicivirga marina]|uniref:DUF4469 domain-containing protein n=1 Tax=Carboxylicivirga marina TaxID=2800988 RepID=A0ABS1HHG9_9BACT|nr:DNA-binding domain-containing protein [Carboxylicivirga marina]MBK3517135.1 DUF4469 domain-containing protein [Carboxylicivirga marina]
MQSKPPAGHQPLLVWRRGLDDVAGGALQDRIYNLFIMALRYGLVPNHLTDDPNDCMAVTTDNDTINVEQIVESMVGKGSTVTRAEALSVIEEYEYAIADAIQKGNNLNTGLFKVQPSISGVFMNDEDGFDVARHAVKLNLNPGKRLIEASGKIELKKVEINSPQPVLQQFINLKSNTINEDFTPGQVASIKGSLLKFDTEDSQQGIFFIADDGTETKVSNVIKNKPSELLLFVPEGLASGIYQVEVRVILHKGKTLKKGRLLFDLVPA